MKLYTMKRMLVCTDFSESSDLVLKAAEELRLKNGGSIDLLHISELGLHLEDVLTDPLKKTYRDVFLGGLKESLEAKILNQVKRCGLSPNIIYRDGKVDEVIVEMAGEGKHDLIVMGHGQKPFIKQLLGSNTAKVISNTPLPLLVIKTTLRLQKIAGLVDESRKMDRIVIGTLDFLRNFQCGEAEFISLWLDFPAPFGNSEEGFKVKTSLNEEIEHYANPSDKTSLRVGPTRELKLAIPLEKILKEDKIDIVVLKKFSEGNPKRAYIGSTTKRLLEIFEGNLLILPP